MNNPTPGLTSDLKNGVFQQLSHNIHFLKPHKTYIVSLLAGVIAENLLDGEVSLHVGGVGSDVLRGCGHLGNSVDRETVYMNLFCLCST